MRCDALRREVDGVPEWLIANGMNMGRWTRIFGVNCLADTHDCKMFMLNNDDVDTRPHVFEVREII